MAIENSQSEELLDTDAPVSEYHKIAIAASTKEERLKSYAEWASVYDDQLSPVASAQSHLADILFANAIIPGESLSVLDVGCGTGLFGVKLSEGFVARDAKVELVGVDFSPEMLEQARKKEVYTRLIKADLECEIPLPPHKFDIFTACGVFFSGHSGPDILPNIVRCLKPGGLGLMTIRGNHWIAEEKLYKDAFDKTGLDVVENVVRSYCGPADGNYIVLKKLDGAR